MNFELVKHNKIILYLFLLGLLLLPLVYWPRAIIPFEIPKVDFVWRWIEILGFLALAGIFSSRMKLPQKKSDNLLIFLVIFFTLVIVVASIFGVDWQKSLIGNYYRKDGILTYLHLAGLFFYLTLFWEKSWEKSTILAICFGCFVTSLLTIIAGIRFHLFGDLTVYHFERAIGVTFGQPNFLAGYFLICLPLIDKLIAEAKNCYQKYFWLTVFVFQILAIFLTLSKAGILGIFLFFVLKLALRYFQFNRRNLVLGLVAIATVGGLILMIWKPKQVDEHYPESRTRIIGRGLIAFTRKPLLGWGWANFDYAFEAVDWPIKFGGDIYVDKAHTSLVEVLVTTGIIGFLVYLVIVGRVLVKIWPHKTWLMVLLLFLFHAQTNVISIAEELFFWLILGIAASS